MLAGLVSFCSHNLSTWIGGRLLLSLRTSFFRHLHALSLDFFEKRQLGDMLSRLSGDIAAIERFLLAGSFGLLTHLAKIVFFVAALFYLRWELALFSLIITPAFWLAARRFSSRLRRISREKRRRRGSISAVAEECLSNIALVQAFNRQEAEVDRFHHQSLGVFEMQLASARIKSLYSPLIDVIGLGGTLLVMGMGMWEFSLGRISLGGLLSFLAFLNRLYGPIRGLGRLSNRVFSASAAAERVIEFLDERPVVIDRPDAVSLGRARGRISFETVSFRYPGGTRDAIADISFQVGPGEVLALVGPSGAGKSTIAKLLLRFYDRSEGRILLDGHDLLDLRLESLRENIAVVLQETLIFHGTIRDNIAYGRPGATEDEIVQASKAADAHEFITSLREGYDTVVGQKGRRLSGGQCQRIAIARAMVRSAPILLLDEPTTGLDAESGRRILEPLRRLMSGRTTIVISHNLLTVREATTIMVLEDGRVVEQGSHTQLLECGGAYARLYRLHTTDYETPARLEERDLQDARP